MHKHSVSWSPLNATHRDATALRNSCLLLLKNTCGQSHSTLHIAMPSLGGGAWLQALPERSTCNHAINQGFFLIQMQAPLDLSTCTWLQWQCARHHRIPFRSPSTRALRWVPSLPSAQRRPSYHTPGAQALGVAVAPLTPPTETQQHWGIDVAVISETKRCAQIHYFCTS